MRGRGGSEGVTRKVAAVGVGRGAMGAMRLPYTDMASWARSVGLVGYSPHELRSSHVPQGHAPRLAPFTALTPLPPCNHFQPAACTYTARASFTTGAPCHLFISDPLLMPTHPTLTPPPGPLLCCTAPAEWFSFLYTLRVAFNPRPFPPHPTPAPPPPRPRHGRGGPRQAHSHRRLRQPRPGQGEQVKVDWQTNNTVIGG